MAIFSIKNIKETDIIDTHTSGILMPSTSLLPHFRSGIIKKAVIIEMNTN